MHNGFGYLLGYGGARLVGLNKVDARERSLSKLVCRTGQWRQIWRPTFSKMPMPHCTGHIRSGHEHHWLTVATWWSQHPPTQEGLDSKTRLTRHQVHCHEASDPSDSINSQMSRFVSGSRNCSILDDGFRASANHPHEPSLGRHGTQGHVEIVTLFDATQSLDCDRLAVCNAACQARRSGLGGNREPQ